MFETGYDLPERAGLRNLRDSTLKLLNYCEANHWEGYDPYDALNSRLLKLIPFLDSKIPRIAFTQVLKRVPFNLRPLLLIPRTQNPKAMGVFLKALLKLEKLKLFDNNGQASFMVERLNALRSPGISYYCWGYSFPWQGRSVLVPQWSPNLVCTVFVADSLLDAYEDHQETRCLDMAHSAASYILDKLYWTENSSAAGFSYPLPELRTRTHNANLLASALLGRIYRHTDESRFLEPALAAARYAVSRQNDDGSWYYGELPSQRWIDNFHTGYNLCALRSFSQYIGTSEFELNISRGMSFYRQNFFSKENAPKYFHDRTYPIDIHCAAQSIITLVELGHLNEASIDLAHSVFNWAMDNMWNERGYFYYRSFLFGKNRISYMRWSQAWMLLALSTLLEEQSRTSPDSTGNTGIRNRRN